MWRSHGTAGRILREAICCSARCDADPRRYKPASASVSLRYRSGVRDGDDHLRQQLNDELTHRRAEIQQILNSYGVPQVVMDQIKAQGMSGSMFLPSASAASQALLHLCHAALRIRRLLSALSVSADVG